MKQKLILAASVAIVAAAACVLTARESRQEKNLYENVEALSSSEIHTYGSCKEEEYECQGECPGCGRMVFVKDHKGPAENIRCCN